MSKHTPGPWEATYEPCEMGNDWRIECKSDTGFVVGVVMYRHDADEWAANAHLIAAAPDLLAALRDIVAWADRAGCSEAFQRDARAAIARAEGGAS